MHGRGIRSALCEHARAAARKCEGHATKRRKAEEGRGATGQVRNWRLQKEEDMRFAGPL